MVSQIQNFVNVILAIIVGWILLIYLTHSSKIVKIVAILKFIVFDAFANSEIKNE
jgi:hypothetical protein